jgi:hypothetical protein
MLLKKLPLLLALIFAIGFTSCQSSLKLAGNKYDQSAVEKDAIASYNPTPTLAAESIEIEHSLENPQGRELPKTAEEPLVEPIARTGGKAKVFVERITPFVKRKEFKEKKASSYRGGQLESLSVVAAICTLLAICMFILVIVNPFNQFFFLLTILFTFVLILLGFVLGLIGVIRIGASEGALGGYGFAIFGMGPILLAIFLAIIGGFMIG